MHPWGAFNGRSEVSDDVFVALWAWGGCPRCLFAEFSTLWLHNSFRVRLFAVEVSTVDHFELGVWGSSLDIL